MKIQKQLKSHGAWIGKWTFILAATGSAVGLGNIWGFPYKAGSLRKATYLGASRLRVADRRKDRGRRRVSCDLPGGTR